MARPIKRPSAHPAAFGFIRSTRRPRLRSVIIIALSESGSCLTLDDRGDYFVLRVLDGTSVKCGDRLLGDFEARQSSSIHARHLGLSRDFQVEVQDFDICFADAIQTFDFEPFKGRVVRMTLRPAR